MPSSDDPIDTSYLPSVLPPTQRRVDPATGLPTKPLLDQEESTRYFFGAALTSAQNQLTTLTSTVDGVTGTVSEVVAVVQDEDGNLVAGRLNTVSTATDTNTASITDLTTSVGALSVRKTVTATLNGSTGFYELSGVQNGDGSGPVFTMAFQANNFYLTDPSYGGGAPQNVFSYSGTYGSFVFNVPVVFNGAAIFNGTVTQSQLAVGAVTQFNSNQLTADQTVGSGVGTVANRQVTGFTNNYTSDGNPSLLDFSCVLDMNVIGASGFPVTVVVYLALDGVIAKTLQTYAGVIFNQRTTVNVTVKVPLIGPLAYAGTAGVHAIDIYTTYVGSAPGSIAAIKSPVTEYAWVLFKR